MLRWGTIQAMRPESIKQSACPCGSGRPFADCCGPLLQGERAPESAEALMRSRYTAYSLGNADWLCATWHESTRPATLDLEQEPKPKWIDLQVKARRSIDADHAEVEFIARFRVGGRAHRLHENSRFVREAGRWYYVDGDVRA